MIETNEEVETYNPNPPSEAQPPAKWNAASLREWLGKGRFKEADKKIPKGLTLTLTLTLNLNLTLNLIR